MPKRNITAGFTLVELSIVLVIIGLLIGGILVAQSMMSTAKVQQFIRQMQQIDEATANFVTKYGTVPGDSIAFSPGGNGNGYIDNPSSGQQPNFIPDYSGEYPAFWQQLQQSGFSAAGVGGQTFYGVYGSCVVFNSGAFTNAPKAVIGTTNSAIIAYSRGLSANGGYHNYDVADFSASDCWNDIGIIANSSINANDAQAYDAKIDDGIPNSGNITSNHCWAAKYPANSNTLCDLNISVANSW